MVKRVGFPGQKEKAQINCDCKDKTGPIFSNCQCSVLVDNKKTKEITVVQLDVPTLQVFLRKKNGKGLQVP